MPAQRVRVTLTGFPGGPGLMTFYAADGASAVGPISTFIAAMKAALPTDLSWSVPASGDIINEITGQATGGWAGGNPTPGVGTDPGGYAAPSGALVRWETGQIRKGRKVRGRTFFVPITSINYQNDGTLVPSLVSGLTTAAVALVAALPGGLFVFQRPRKATPQWTDVRGKVHPAKAATVGELIPITSAMVPDKSVVLRSRRD